MLGLTDEMLAELAALNYTIDPKGRIAIEDKASARSALGRSPDLAEALMLALGEPDLEPFTYISVGPRIGSVSWAFSHRGGGGRDTCQKQDDLEDAAEDPTVILSQGVDRNGRLMQAPMPWSDLGGRRQRRAY